MHFGVPVVGHAPIRSSSLPTMYTPSAPAMTAAARAMLQAPDVMPPPPDAPEPDTEDTLQLRIIALFVILIAGFGGGVLPLVIKVLKNPGHPATLIVRAGAAGVMLALAFIHVQLDGATQLADLYSYAFAPVANIIGVLIMIASESMARTYLANHANTDTNANTIGLDGQQDEEAGKATKASVQVSTPDAGGAGSSHDHAHTCIAVQNVANWAVMPLGATLRDQVLAYMFELACITHSVLIGVALGVSLDKTDVTVLLIVLIFHQGLEGVGLGSTLVRAGFSNLKCLIMVFTYAIMTPLGVAIGIAAAGSYDPESVTSLAVQGTLNSVSAGLLMYIALVQLIAEDFTREDVHRRGAGLLRAAMFGALLIGVGAMAVIGIWA